MELNFLKVSGQKVPSQITEKDMEALLLLPTKSQRYKYFRFLFTKEKMKAKDHARELRRKEAVVRRAEMRQSNETHMQHGRFKNTYLMRILDNSMNRIDYNRLVYAAKFEQNIVFDMSYDKYMKNYESMNTASQLKHAYSFNKKNTAPCHINFCNVNREDKLYDDMLKHLPNFKNDDFLCNVTEKSFMDVFPRDRLVYLSPDAPQVLQNYDHDAIYIIAAYVDKGKLGDKISLANSKKLDINMAKLPLDTYLRFKGNKVLTIDQVFKILLTMKNTGKWREALMHVPKRILEERL
ncbi:tRNA methyltransferase 10 C [Nymphon striatum]|nr:tRNA methyltransferase 10 C [Nymphon striatum]